MNICLVGSTRFKELYNKTNFELTKLGHCVYTVSTMMHADSVPLTHDEKETLDLVHLAKIMNSDQVVWVTDDTDYIGDSTRRELKWAHMLSKQVVHCKSVLANQGGLFDTFQQYPIIPKASENESKG